MLPATIVRLPLLVCLIYHNAVIISGSSSVRAILYEQTIWSGMHAHASADVRQPQTGQQDSPIILDHSIYFLGTIQICADFVDCTSDVEVVSSADASSAVRNTQQT